MEGCSKTSDGPVPILPDDPVVEILSRVPAKSVCRFKCVSKAWRDLIADPDNRKKLPQDMQGLFVQVFDYSEVDNARLTRSSFSFIDLTVRSVPREIGSSFSFLTEMTGIQTFLLDSCNGLILFGHHKELSDPPYYTMCNPTTKQWSAVPACDSGEPLSNAYLAFDPAVSSHFHLVQLQVPELSKQIVALHVYSSETGTWSQNQIDEQKEKGQLELEGWHHQCTLDIWTCNHLCAFVNGFLRLIVSCSDLQHILVVDVRGKARRMIVVPGMADGRPGHAFVCYLGQSQGHLHCVSLDSSYKFNKKLSTWVLEDYDTQEWVLKNTLDVLREIGGSLEFRMVDIHLDCNVILFLQDSCKLTAYDMDHKEVSVIATFKDYKIPYVPYFTESPELINKHSVL